MLFFRCCVKCQGDLLLEANSHLANLKCLKCGNKTEIPSDTHLYKTICGDLMSSKAMARAA